MSFYRPFVVTPELQTNIDELTTVQKKLREQVQLIRPPSDISVIAGCDSAFMGDTILSIFVTFSYPDLTELEVQCHSAPTTLPYIPGFLAFREIPNLMTTYQQLTTKPDLIMVDGQGILHPRRMGIATHLGILTNTPTIGVAKKKLVGSYIPPGETKGEYTPIHHQQEHVGYVLRSKDRVKPIFISPGHLCDHESALDITLKTLRKHKLPEPTRIADLYSKNYKSKLEDLG